MKTWHKFIFAGQALIAVWWITGYLTELPFDERFKFAILGIALIFFGLFIVPDKPKIHFMQSKQPNSTGVGDA